MAPCKPAKTVKIRVPRQNAQRLGPSLTSQENASEWNSLLLSARAQRGPFWDIGTQQFLVEKESELYYDSTALLEAARSLTSGGTQNANSEATSSTSQQHQHQLQQQQQQQQQHQIQMQQQQQRHTYTNQQYAYAGNTGTPTMRHTTPARNMPYPGTPGSGQFYGDSVTPARLGMIEGVNPSPEVYGRRITRGMSDGYQGYGH
ncbi:hypothetical protein EW145_g4095 [Phellinidium pouzarii]|uniref:Uncharacterized protein n=1 Tax=Phellinidium pouzarii TaxID=167371 RepID=A0A4S4L4S6_9AGAM|nr:hypothetical protein EW145_g4095 [Phellinidium pouzarii]